MQVILRGVSGPGAGRERAAGEGEAFTVGRTDRADVVIAEDTFLSGVHFRLSCGAGRAVLHDMSSRNGVTVNGNRVEQAGLNEGDLVVAGATTFAVRLRDEGRAIVSATNLLAAAQEPVYAVLDGARDPSIYPFVLNCGMPYCSLYRGDAESDLEMVAPYLVYLAPGSAAMAGLIARGWAKSWGIFLTCGYPMEEVRKQLRRSLKVGIEGSRAPVYFRFYDPRVLRRFLPIADLSQFNEFAGPITSFLVEDEKGEAMLRFQRSGSSVISERLEVGSPEGHIKVG